MDSDLKPGLHHSEKFVITESDLASKQKTGDVAYASTPSLIVYMEKVVCGMIHSHINDSSTSVSAEINIKHLIPIPEGTEITSSVHLKFAENNKLFFDFAIFNNKEDIIAIGAHERIIVPKDVFE